ncbi:NAD(P)H-binding protein [Microlunatus sp. Gsoil 973]|uniref:NAD(P)H-binding protein n=1 Tax=Microlunatus sp. Gsoil 973 TaxID=2672569 RepID=UPI0012B463D0|nr:NAD(P)H-binding protein [Microlunatus sp. Gsoil 973]QGN34165.1 NAD(P)H-binding protein [Microlunatus sp. Gsoil 973]
MIVVTAPTGKIGSLVLDHLLATDTEIRVIARHPEKLAPAVRDRVEVITGSHGDPDVIGKALVGADALFWLLLADPQAPDVESAFVDFTRPATEAISDQGVGHVVGISALGRGTAQADRAGLATASLAMDDLLAGSGAGYRALVMPGFMDNLLWQTELIRNQGFFSEPQPGDLRLPRVATKDIAAVAAELLLDRSWTGIGEVPVLGPEDLSQLEMAEIMSEVLGRRIDYRQMPYEDYKAMMLAQGRSGAIAQAMVDMAVAKANGLDLGVTRTAENSTPTSFRQWCAEVLAPDLG